jgi:predicted GNAT family N-acyltransferase
VLPGHRVWNELDAVTIEPARDELLSECLAFRGKIFSREQGTSGLDQYDAGAVHLVARRDQEILAVCRIVLPSERPFALESYFDLSPWLPTNARVGELGRYALRRDLRSISKSLVLHLGMLKLALIYAREAGLDFLVSSVQPQLRTFYLRAHYTPIGDPFVHPTYGETTIMLVNLAMVWPPGRPMVGSLRLLLENPQLPRVLL